MHTVVIHSVLLLFCVTILPFCSPLCRSGIPNHLKSSKSQSWRLCLKKFSGTVLQLRIINFFNTKENLSRWLAIGLPGEKDEENIDFFVVVQSGQGQSGYKLKQLETARKHVNCTNFPQKKPATVRVKCRFSNSKIKYQNSKKINILYSYGSNTSVDLKHVMRNLVNKPSFLSFYIRQNVSHKTKVKEHAGSTAMKLLRNYGKSMAAIVGISLFLTIVISLTICCCCKTKQVTPSKPVKEKDVSVSFYRDNGEADGGSDYSDNDEKVAFIRKDNDKNSNV